MKAAYDLIPTIAKLTGASESRTETYYRRLNEAGLIPRSAGRARENLNATHAVLWILAMLADVPSRCAADTARAYFDLYNPAGERAGPKIVHWLESWIDGSEYLDALEIGVKLGDRDIRTHGARVCIDSAMSRIELDCGDEPRIRIISEDSEGKISEEIYGPQDRPWMDRGIRKTYTIPGNVLFRLSRALFS